MSERFVQNFSICIDTSTNTCTAGLDDHYELTKKITGKPEELRLFRDHHWKALGEKKSDLLGIFLCDSMLISYFFKDAKTGPQQKYIRQNWIRLVK